MEEIGAGSERIRRDLTKTVVCYGLKRRCGYTKIILPYLDLSDIPSYDKLRVFAVAHYTSMPKLSSIAKLIPNRDLCYLAI